MRDINEPVIRFPFPAMRNINESVISLEKSSAFVEDFYLAGVFVGEYTVWISVLISDSFFKKVSDPYI